MPGGRTASGTAALLADESPARLSPVSCERLGLEEPKPAIRKVGVEGESDADTP